ncbi:hypothetical protein IMZ48_18900 [Candidatus Bathyarchaeota archaeon]|nr:hypothetical protein [Candidatus Bathyarchaeota archaeon]
MDPPTQADELSQEPPPQLKLAKALYEAGFAAFDPSLKKSSDEAQEARAEFQRIVDR